jgi:hypothetical protein
MPPRPALTMRIVCKPRDGESFPAAVADLPQAAPQTSAFSPIKAQVSCRLLSNTVRSTASCRRRSRRRVQFGNEP